MMIPAASRLYWVPTTCCFLTICDINLKKERKESAKYCFLLFWCLTLSVRLAYSFFYPLQLQQRTDLALFENVTAAAGHRNKRPKTQFHLRNVQFMQPRQHCGETSAESTVSVHRLPMEAARNTDGFERFDE